MESQLTAQAERPAQLARTMLGLGAGQRADQHHKRIRELGLERYVAELDSYGYAVVPPELVAPREQVEKITQAVLRLAEKRSGVKHELHKNSGFKNYREGGPLTNNHVMFYVLFEDPAFEDWLENPVLQAMVDHMMRGAAQVSSYTSHVKWKGGGFTNKLGLHTDTPPSPEGLLPATHDNVCNAVLALTDYKEQDGALAVVPGSHLLFRQPQVDEGLDEAIPVEAPAGSLILWHGALWHGAYRKQTDGLRLNLTAYFCNRMLKTQERYQRDVPKEMLDRHSPWFARVLGADDAMGWTETGPQPTYLANALSGRS